MTSQAVEGFYQKVMQTPALQEQFKRATNETDLIDMAVKLGAQNGYAFTADDVKARLAPGISGAQLSDRELETVAGGAISWGGSITCGYCGPKSPTAEIPV